MSNTFHPLASSLTAVLVGVTLATLLASSVARADEPSSIDDQFEKYWGEKVPVPSVYRRVYAQKGRHEGTLYSGVVPNDSFFAFFPIGLRYNWYPIEDLSIEVSGSYLFSKRDDLQKFVETKMLSAGDVGQTQTMDWNAAVGLTWTPLRGKVGAFNARLGHFDFGFAGGAAVLGTTITNATNPNGIAKVAGAGYLGATLRFYFTSFFALRVDYRHFMYKGVTMNEQGKEVSTGLAAPAEITLGFSFFTPAN